MLRKVLYWLAVTVMILLALIWLGDLDELPRVILVGVLAVTVQLERIIRTLRRSADS